MASQLQNLEMGGELTPAGAGLDLNIYGGSDVSAIKPKGRDVIKTHKCGTNVIQDIFDLHSSRRKSEAFPISPWEGPVAPPVHLRRPHMQPASLAAR